MELSYLDESPTAHLIRRHQDGRDGRKYLTVGLLKGEHDPANPRSWFLTVAYPTGKPIHGFPKLEKMRHVDYGHNIPYKYKTTVEHMKRELLERKKGMI